MLNSVMAHAAIRYVKPVASGLGNGTSWANASSDLQLMINNSGVNDEVWVAAGTYNPLRRADLYTGPLTIGNRLNAFVLKQGVSVYGGFAGNETLLTQRNLFSNQTILSGDINTPDEYTDNCYHIVISGSAGPHSLDGFYIQKAFANGSVTYSLFGQTFNTANGGAIVLESSGATIQNCIISGNYAQGNGGAVCSHQSNSRFINCVFSGNRCGAVGSAIHFEDGSTFIYNCTVSGNKSTANAGAIGATGDVNSKFIFNSIIYGNNLLAPEITPANLGVQNCIIRGGYAGLNVTANDPVFLNAVSSDLSPTTLGNYNVRYCGPATDAGNNALLPIGLTKDLSGNPRIFNGTVDIGAYELQSGLPAIVPGAGGIVYVNKNIGVPGNGSGWATATDELAHALKAAQTNAAIQEIWVAAGTYSPLYDAKDLSCTPADHRDKAFLLVNNVKIYGGFAGTETLLSQRNWKTNITTLSGDIGIKDFFSDNSYHVVIGAGNTGNAVLDGFVVTKGNANGGSIIEVNGTYVDKYRGGGISLFSSSPAISNCSITDNYGSNGGAIAVLSSSPVFNHCVISGNTARWYGGAIDQYMHVPTASNAVLNNCMVTGNKSFAVGGAFVNTAPSVLTVNNSTIAGNYAVSSGGGLWNPSANVPAVEIVNNSIVWGNRAGSSGNNIFLGSTGVCSATNSLFEEATGYSGTGNIIGDPFFAGAVPASSAPTAAGNYRLPFCSPAVNAGNNAIIPATTTLDLDNNPRIFNATADMGAFELQSAVAVANITPGAGGIVYVNKHAAVPGNGSSWANAAPELADALRAAKTNTSIQQIWVAAGTYYPLYEPVALSCNPADNRDKTFLLVTNVKVYGGFNGTETLASQRNPATNITILNGDIGTPDVNTDNAYHVVVSSGSAGTAELSGFTITGGNANLNLAGGPVVNGNTIQRRLGGGLMLYSSSPDINNCNITGNAAIQDGGGIYFGVISVSGDFSNCTISGNTSASGAGLYATTVSASSAFDNCIFSGNTSTSNGAGVCVISGALRFNNCTISGNSGSSGGGIYVLNSSNFRINNCLTTGNASSANGGGLWSSNSSPIITNSTFGSNRAAANGGGLYFALNPATAPRLYNSIVYGNKVSTAANNIITNTGATAPVVYYSIVETATGYTDGGNNSTANPLFIDPLNASAAPDPGGNYRLQQCSPAVNTGFNLYTTSALITVDIDNNTRIQNTTVDRGAFETAVTLPVPDVAGIVYVNRNIAVPGNGSSWANAITELADALKAAKTNTAIKEIWVAKGTYYPLYDAVALSCSPADNRVKTFLLVADVKVYGGFAGGEYSVEERDYLLNETILDGDIGVPGDNTDNAYHVVVGSGSVGTAELSGFTITRGNASLNLAGGPVVNGNTIQRRLGGGIMLYSSSPAINKCNITGNAAILDGGGVYFAVASLGMNFSDCSISNNTCSSGAGIYITNISGGSTFSNCKIVNNTATSSGGGIYAIAAAVTLANCIVSGNSGSSGGGIYIFSSPSSLAITNCLFSGNNATNQGGGMWCSNSSPVITNCTFTGNRAVSVSGGLYFTLTPATAPKIYNCIVFGNKIGTTVSNIVTGSGPSPDASYSMIENASGYTDLGNNSTADPLFINPENAAAAPTAAGNYRLQKCSPAINTGSNALVPPATTKDLDSNSRVFWLTVDRGAYEKHLAKPGYNGIVYVDSASTAAVPDGSSWATAIKEVADALKEARTNTDIKEIWVAKGTYKPIYDADDAFVNSVCHTTDRDASFVLAKDVKMYGGFAGGEADTSGRDIIANETILSGDIGIANDTIDNCYHVAISAGDVGSSLLDGFSVVGGTAAFTVSSGAIIVNSGTVSRPYGGGLYSSFSSPFINQCSFYNNYAINGGAIYSSAGGKLTISKSCLYNNTAFDNSFNGGGAIFSTTADISDCIFNGNYAAYSGGAVRVGGTANIINSIFTGNKAQLGGAILKRPNSNLYIKNCTIAGNHASSDGGGLHNTNNITDSTQIYNTIIWNNEANLSGDAIYGGSGLTIQNSLVQGGHAGVGNIDEDPLFVFPQSPFTAPTTLGDYHLQPCSPAINMGSNSLIPAGLSTDLDNLERIMFNTVDMGAYEVQTSDFANSTWKGVNTNWNDKVNWCGGYVPVSTTNVAVPATSNNPVINAGYDNGVKNILFANNTSIGIVNTGKLTINGTYTNNGCTISNNGDWIMAGNAGSQTFPGTLATVTAMNNLEVNNPSGLKFDKSFQLTGTLTPTAGNINVDNATITLHSDATGTASVAPVPPGVAFSYTGTGDFEVERYIPPHRAWRLLTAPLSAATNLSISQAWQEGLSNASRLSPVNTWPGFGTTITKSTTYNAADGYDQGSTNSPSIRYYTGTNWGGVPSQTNGTTPGANNGLINDQQGYMLFVRGDRSIVVSGTGVVATPATLRPKGQLKVGSQTVNCTGWTVIGNPYASPVNFHKIVLDNPGLPDVFYVWDANLNGSNNVGGWVTYGAYNSGSQTYTVTPLLPGSTFANNKGDISSGSAFMVNYTGTITINESNKSTLGDNVLFRPGRQLRMNLYTVHADSSETLNDGIAVLLDNATEPVNAEKNRNFTENLAIAADNKLYAIQNRQRPQFNDTIFIYTGQMKQRNYVLELKASELNMPDRMKAFLEDTYLQRYSPVSLEGNTRYPFAVTTDSASFSAARFRLLFKKAPRFKSITAKPKESDIEVQWEMEDDFGIGQYTIEKSVNGIDFTDMHTITICPYQFPLMQYHSKDKAPETGAHYYRIKATGIDGEVVFSDIVKTDMVNNKAGIYVYPNPVTGNLLHLRMNRQLEGPYSATLINSAGQRLLIKQWQHRGGFVTRQLVLPALAGTGWYVLEIIGPAGSRKLVKFEVQ